MDLKGCPRVALFLWPPEGSPFLLPVHAGIEARLPAFMFQPAR